MTNIATTVTVEFHSKLTWFPFNSNVKSCPHVLDTTTYSPRTPSGRRFTRNVSSVKIPTISPTCSRVSSRLSKTGVAMSTCGWSGWLLKGKPACISLWTPSVSRAVAMKFTSSEALPRIVSIEWIKEVRKKAVSKYGQMACDKFRPPSKHTLDSFHANLRMLLAAGGQSVDFDENGLHRRRSQLPKRRESTFTGRWYTSELSSFFVCRYFIDKRQNHIICRVFHNWIADLIADLSRFLYPILMLKWIFIPLQKLWSVQNGSKEEGFDTRRFPGLLTVYFKRLESYVGEGHFSLSCFTCQGVRETLDCIENGLKW